MTIVASNSLTISNVNDGTITHTAYAYSADGTDRFTTVYPNLNLLEGSKDFSGDWWLVERSENDGTYKGLTVKKSEGPGITKQFIAPKDGIYTFSAYVKGSGDSADIHRSVTLNSVTGKIVPDKSMGNNFAWLRDSFQVTLKAGDKIYAQYNVAGSGVLWNAGHKWEEGSAATDDLTANYPNLNLLEGSTKYTKDNPKTLSSNSTDGWFFVDDVFVKNLKAGTYTMSGKADAPWTVHDTSGAKKGKVGLWLVSTTPGLNVNISLGDTVPKTIEVPKDGDYCVRINTYSNGKDIETHKFWDFKLEPGSTATPCMPSKNELQEQLTPWMPSLSEVTTSDWPKYRGEYSDMSSEQSTYPYDYTWSLIRGNDGKDGADGHDGRAGKDGVGIKTTVITYAISTSGTTAPNTGWTNSVPSLVKGQYLWTKTVWTYSDTTSETGYSVTYIAKDGNDGNDGIAGKDGTGIKTTTITYAGSTSGTIAPSSGWATTVPTVAAGSYLWTKTVWAYTDNTSETGYSVAKMGNNGATGPQGPPGSNGDPGKIVSNTEPTTRFKGLTWKYIGMSDLTASDGTVIKPNTEYYYNGTHWVINYFSVNNFAAESITSDKIDAKNLIITDGEFVSTTTNGPVTTSTEIKDNHIAISKTDGTVNTKNDLAVDTEQGFAMKFTNNTTGLTREASVNFQGVSTSDSNGNYAQLTPQGTKLSTDVPWTNITRSSGVGTSGTLRARINNGVFYAQSKDVTIPSIAPNSIITIGTMSSKFSGVSGFDTLGLLYSIGQLSVASVTVGNDGKINIGNPNPTTMSGKVIQFSINIPLG
ncbi:hypothetical protein GJI78_08400 [Lactococcus lactis subsp. cremoris]|uniref:Prophage pi3 protein 09 n=1 Tax=Lactococcus lactis subsp. lactis (strain IL1403) TaxID=272623 RepID=Q9CFT2_LACLA|nr:hypothetical protein [Lactococcus lactis]NP_076691.1 tail protein [Lactococcus phage bIL286]MRM76497.1 hypothetical protein [Lactococcus cremoris]AAK05481.1 prophage pi3 protein 09 [Lactococcus lactis subsp. lactis Il1403]AAK08344.1 host-specificity [Lactococcus phage bIL286]AYV53104.1 hypothetical protein EFV54_07375 [Lactococcus lactis]MRL48083.1 hypothetical protein [Lactococcus lactis subsp. lactis]